MDIKNHQYLKTIKTKRKYEGILLSKEGVVGCGVGLDRQGKLGIVVYISGESAGIPQKLGDIYVFTEEVRPDEEWVKKGKITTASVQALGELSSNAKLVKLRSANKVDAALAGPFSPDLYVPEILELGIPKGTREAYIGMQVKKSGRTTGVTDGIVKACDVSIFVDYSTLGYGLALFVQQIVTTPMAEPGDSV